MYRNLSDFITALDRAGELRRITAPVSPLLEIAEIADRESKSRAPYLPSDSARRNDPRFHDRGGSALLFTNVEGADHPVLINAFGSYRRLEIALGCNDPGHGVSPGHTPGGFDALAAKIAALVKPEPPRSLSEALAKARQFAPLLRIGPKRARRAPCQEVTIQGDDVDLTSLPILRCWPLDGDLAAVNYPSNINDNIPNLDLINDPSSRGRYITFAGIHTIHADDLGAAKPSSHNIGMYRVQLIGRRRLGMHWHMHHDGARHWRSWKRRGERMPVAIALGGESILPFATIAPMPPGISELLFAGFLNRGGIPMTRCKTVPLRVPANAEIIIEGYVSADSGPPGYDPRTGEPLGPGAFFEGPFGDHTGFYSLPDRYPIVEVTAVTMRRNPIYPTTIVGLPPQEDYYLGKATERIFLPLLKTIVPDIEDYDLPTFGAFHNCAAIQIRKEYPLQGRRIMHSVWGAGQMAWTKTIFVVDHDVDVHDVRAVLEAASRNCAPGTDIEFVKGPLDILDHAAPYLGAGTKVGFDATRKITGEENAGDPIAQRRASPKPTESESSALLARATEIASIRAANHLPMEGGGWLFLQIESDSVARSRAALANFLASLSDAPVRPRFVIAVSPDVNIHNIDEALFHWCANCDPGRDALWSVDRRTLAFDATAKREGESVDGAPVRAWPPLIRMDESTKSAIDARAAELGLRGA
ncbi:MAG: UbiD family decarboxylase [Planctomycetota bacterium]|nr:UbiD family decarboxylase [Planctomycetota bacterium]